MPRRIPSPDASALELQLTAIVDAHPLVEMHPYSGSGPRGRAVMWRTTDDLYLGQVIWEPDTQSWTVHAVDRGIGEDSLYGVHPTDISAIPDAITHVLRALRAPAALDTVVPGLGDTIRRLRYGL